MKRAAAVAVVAIAGGLALGAFADARPGSVVRVEHHDGSAAPSLGPSTAPVTIELFFVPWLQSRSNAWRYVHQLAARHPTRVRIVYRVLEANGHALLPPAALEAEAEGKFVEFMDAIDAERQQISKARLLEIGAKIGLDPQRLADATTRHYPVLDANAKRLQRFHRAAPDILIDGVPAAHPLGQEKEGELEQEYASAYAHALELEDRGADPASLGDAFDAEAMSGTPHDIKVGPTDENLESEPVEPPLAQPPLDLRGLPSFGPAGAAVPIVLLCKPTSANCATMLAQAKEVQRLYPERVRVVWAPWYDVTQDGASDLGLLGDAALCAETVGTGDDDPTEDPASSGWRWVEGILADAKDRKNRKASAVEVIDRVAKKLRVDEHAFAECRARTAGAATARNTQEHKSGVHASPTLVVGGRIYHGGVANKNQLQELVEAELAPGVLEDLAPSWERR